MSRQTDTVALRGATPAESAGAARREGRWFGLAAVGGLLGGLGAVACCILPLVLFSLGVGGVWLGRLVALEVYQPVFVALALGSLALGYGLAWRRRRAACGDGALRRVTRPVWPMRASSWNQTSIARPGCSAASSAIRRGKFL